MRKGKKLDQEKLFAKKTKKILSFIPSLSFH
jgi:hypothetical protein